MDTARRRCAIYTRKSSEEGLEQSFNSLNAQREACQAYIKSQAHEGWLEIGIDYSDGGYSGGTMSRPALQRLLADLGKGLVDVVVVYKVDRLTRSLADFAKIVELLDSQKASFVSITQQFNTTTSMGRLTLNVLLSFAQFEREVTGERIRDKIAASKRRGMWMGGNVPLGYDVVNRQLMVNEKEAKTVQVIFERYLQLKTVAALKRDLEGRGIRSKIWKSSKGNERGGAPYSRGALYYLLRNQTYIGRVVHKKSSYPGNHSAIVPETLWNSVQTHLEKNRSCPDRKPNVGTRSPLVGLIYDDRGNSMSPSYVQRPHGRRYRYYVSQALLQHDKKAVGSVGRISASLAEDLVKERIRGLVKPEDNWNGVRMPGLRQLLERVVVGSDKIEIVLKGGVRSIVTKGMIVRSGRNSSFLEFGSALRPSNERPATSLIKAVCRASNWLERYEKGEVRSYAQLARSERLSRGYIKSVMQVAFLAPDLVETILRGENLISGGITSLLSGPLPASWHEQRKLFAARRETR